MAAMAAVASMATMTSPKSIAPCSSIAVGKVVAITPLCRSTRVGFGVANLSGRRWTPLVVVQAQVEKSSVQERSWEEKDRDLVASQGFFQDQSVEYEGIEEAEEEEEEKEEDYGVDVGANAAFNAAGGEEDYGEVNKILASRVVDGETQYLIEWKDDHPDSWEPPANIANDVVYEYETPWWQAAKKGDDQKLQELLQDEGRDVNAIDENKRTALFFASGLGSEKCVKMLLEEGADVHWQDKDGFTALHIAAGYVHTSVVKALLAAGADPELEDEKGRSSLMLAQELLERTPRTNPMQFARRLALDQVVKLLDEAIYETVEVEQILDKRIVGNVTEYLVKWSDDSEESWETTENIAEDLIKDYEEGLEYGIAEKIVDKREVDGKAEYLVQWADSTENTWEPADNVADEIIAEFESQKVTTR
ncbi:signal recognition particle 43 kDa protein, chloroplastic-like [Physcomitrium patens]|nr:signal recognition particle 43 kDa protein, chloroplastic-like [Physcomitrium patens]|eukprot:XP_024362307.1 signal recognition particle 43 kDa protein, chloroplastic-like [Physcomitrella patens]